MVGHIIYDKNRKKEPSCPQEISSNEHNVRLNKMAVQPEYQVTKETITKLKNSAACNDFTVET